MKISFIPYKQITIKSPLSKDEILNAVKELTVPIKQEFTLFYYDNDVLSQYNGDIDKNSFKLTRVVYKAGSGNPAILGSLSSNENKTYIYIKYRAKYFNLIFISIWMLFALYGFINAIIYEISQNYFDFRVLYLLIFVVVAYLMILIPFNVTCKKPTIDFLKVFKGEVIEEE
ncbi:MAG: hypothetical protein NTW25_16435 [Candidatus Kapabacteria bacterium]|nr:hypothetical protein [Candidatus Kapabacteria bacterium]